MPGTQICKTGVNCFAPASDVLYCLEGELLCRDKQGVELVNDIIKTNRGDQLISFSNVTQTIAEKV